MNDKYNKHLTLDDRIQIQECLSHGMNFKQIARRIGKSQTTISREIKKHLEITTTCHKFNDNGNEISCPKLLKPPFVCNGCHKCHSNCNYKKQMYYGAKSHKEYSSILHSCREGVALNKQSFYDDDKIISDCLEKGQHLRHIFYTNKLNVSISTAYRHLKKGYYSASIIDLPRAVKFKPRKQHKQDYVPKGIKISRSYEHFQNYILENNITNWVEMDTVIGRVGGKTLLTFDFTFCNFMIGILLEDKTQLEVTKKIIDIKQKLKENGYKFGKVFPVIITDNGGEFSNVFCFEKDLDGNEESKLFYCDPNSPYQKPRVENTHTQLRNILPKGTSFDKYTQKEIDEIFSNINSVKKMSLFGKSSYEVFTGVYGKELAGVFNIKEIPAQDVIQNKKLLKKI